MLSWKVGFALAGGARAGKTQVCLGNMSVDGASVVGRIGFGGNGRGREKHGGLYCGRP